MHDVIVVGAGTAGCVLAERLTRSGRLKVLLLEAGGKPSSPFVKMPAGFARLFKSKLDWNLESEPQTQAGRRIYVPRGKMLGGSSNMNAQIHQWCHPGDFDSWAAAGADGWGWDEVAPVFRAQERWLGAEGDVERGSSGPMLVSPNANAHPLSLAFVAAARRAGLGDRSMYNGGHYHGAWLCEIAHDRGRRFSAYDAYLRPALRRPGLEVVTDAHAHRVVFDGERASGVTVTRGGAEQTLRASAGVVLAGGAFGSPQLLMLSGIGPASMLADFGIRVRRDAPEVGANLQDHPLSPVLFVCRSADTFKNAESPFNLLRYFLFKRGMLASNAVEAFAFASSNGDPDSPPDVEVIFVPFEWRNQGLEPPQIHAFGLASAVVAPRSRGRVALRSADPRETPLIDLGLLTDPEAADARALVYGARLARMIAATSPLSEHCSDEIFPGDSVDDDGVLQRKLEERLQTVYHPTSTCRMGSDQGAVVDPRLRVRGTRSLWIADASVMPSVPRGHPNAVVAMIANRAAEWIESELVSM